ncbi:MAG TPA: cellulase family glycosylhydrolase, partial [Bacteroidales bacterium]|nr:cellulase family glycosylhydrolase [Bacteroidales bacterium]
MKASPTTHMPLKSRATLLYMVILIFLSITRPIKANPMEGDSVITDLHHFCASQKGFNLLGKFDVNWSNDGYRESDFSMIHELGFNFVRLPVDYRTYTQAGDWDVFLENEVQDIDNAIQWGSQYDVHVSLNLHRAPGYCVNTSAVPPNQDLDLWTDSLAQQAFVRHWEYFAQRYKDIAPSRLSFNLVNEPSGVSEDAYVKVMQMAIEAIHNISPERIIFVDGLDYGRNLIPALKDEPYVAQAVHCYDPF